MITPQTNTDIPQLAAALASCSSFALVGHVSPDGDCLGSQLALGLALRKMGKEVTQLLVDDAPVEYGLHFLPGFDDLMPAAEYQGTPEAFITCDVSTAARIGAADEIRKRARVTFSIDHHAGSEVIARYHYVDPDCASTTMIIWDVVKALGATAPDVALCAYTGLMTDTGRFQYQNTDASSFDHAREMIAAGARPDLAAREVFQNRSLPSLKLEERMLDRMRLLHDGHFAFSYLTLDDFSACGAERADAEPLIDTLRSIRGVSVACILKERPEVIRGSLRAKDDADVSVIARQLGGGGHKAAAGFTYEGRLIDCIEKVEAAIASLFPEKRG